MGLASRKPLSYAGSEHPLWTHSMHDDGRKILEVWCENIPGLVRTGTCSWALQGKTEISYPRGGHASIADIEESSFWFKHRNAVIAAVVRRFPPPGPVFDIGGGNGYVSLGLCRAGFDCLVIEPGPIGAHNALGRGLAVVQAPFQDLMIADASIPAAGLFDVLEHIQDDRGALTNLHRVLQPGGRLYIAVPAYNFLWSGEDDHAGHFRRYTLNLLRQRLVEAGFTVDYGTYFFLILLLPVFLLRALPAKFGISIVNDPGQDHAAPVGFVSRLLKRSFAWERRRIEAGKTFPLGASCLVVARKP